MPSPFPGVDPFLEDQGYWKEFHSKYISWVQDTLAEQVPNTYEVRIEERLSLIYEPDPDFHQKAWTDVAVDRSAGPSRAGLAPSGTITLEPVTLSLPRYVLEEVIEHRIEIRRFPERELVTVIELLSPSNKEAPGDQVYSKKRLGERQNLIYPQIRRFRLDRDVVLR